MSHDYNLNDEIYSYGIQYHTLSWKAAALSHGLWKADICFDIKNGSVDTQKAQVDCLFTESDVHLQQSRDQAGWL